MQLTEEARPLAEKYITATGWAELGSHRASVMPRNRLDLPFGVTVYENPDVMKGLLKGAPLRVRVLMPMRCREYAKRLHGTASPPRVWA